MTCTKCGEEMTAVEGSIDGDTTTLGRVRVNEPAWVCPCCGETREDSERPEPFDEMTGPMD